MIQRTLAGHARDVFAKYPVITFTGPRQSGKTTLAGEKMIVYAGNESQERNGIKVTSPFKLAAELNKIDQSDH